MSPSSPHSPIRVRRRERRLYPAIARYRPSRRGFTVTGNETISRILFHAVGGNGLGHVSRQVALARAIRGVRPATEVAFATPSVFGPALAPEFPFFILPPIDQLQSAAWSAIRWSSGATGHSVNGAPDPTSLVVELASPLPTLMAMTQAMVATYRPGLVIHDTLVWPALFQIAEDLGVRQALVLRARRDLADVVSDPSSPLMRTDLVIVPHDASEAAEIVAAIPADGPPSACIGRTVRGATMSRHEVCERLCVADHTRLIVVTAGGGGAAGVPDFYRLALSALASASSGADDCLVVLVLGPEYRSAPPTSRHLELQVWHAIPWMPDLIAAADLVICQAGYNTLGEAQAAGTPAVVVPAECAFDDQHARAQKAMRSDRQVRILEGEDVGALTKLIGDALTARAHRPPSADRPPDAVAGERVAALSRIIELAEVARGGARDGQEPLVVHRYL